MSGNNEKAEKKIYSLIGMCKKAGFAASGEFMTEKSVKGGKSFLCIVAGDASDNTKKNFRDMSTYYGVPYYEFGNKDMLGAAIGCEFRASVSINNEGLAKSIISQLNSMNEE